MLWYNKGIKEQQSVFNDIKAAYCNHNFSFIGRFAFALLAQTEYVAIYDDDTIPGRDWYKNCLETIEKYNGIIGTKGVRLINLSFINHEQIGWNSHNKNIEEVDLVGHCWFLKREWLKYFWMEDPPLWNNCEDLHLSYTCLKYGNIKTYIASHPSEHINLWGSIKGLEYGTDDMASSMGPASGSFYKQREDCLLETIKRGWEPLFLRNKK
jgi:cellulose synthase/poly-beta-1,6-N-acetylglucosamine synthase-like glycosyltransferase